MPSYVMMSTTAQLCYYAPLLIIRWPTVPHNTVVATAVSASVATTSSAVSASSAVVAATTSTSSSS